MRRTAPVALLVADETGVPAVLQRALEAAGYLVARATEDAAARARIEQGDVGLVLLDLDLRRLDGLALCRHLRARPAARTVPLCVLSGRADGDARAAAFAAGANHYLVKPIDAADLRGWLSTWREPR